MAGFSLEVNDVGVDIPRYVAPANVSPLANTVGGLASIGEGLLGLQAARDRAARAAQPTQGQVNQAAYGALAEGLYSLNGVDDPAQVRARVGELVAEYEMSGFQLGTEETDLILRTSGIAMDVIPPMDAAANTMMRTLGDNPEYLALAERQLRQSGQTPTEESVTSLAYSIYQSQEADLLLVSTYKAGSNADFQAFSARANGLIGSLTQVALEGLSIEASGGDVTVESIMGLENNLSVLRAVLTRPTGVDASLYAPITEQLDALGVLIEQIKAVDAQTLDLQSTEMLQAASRVLLAQAGQEGGPDAALAAAALQTPEGRTQFFTANAELIQTAIRSSRAEVLAVVGQVGLEAVNLDFTPFNDILNPPAPDEPDEPTSTTGTPVVTRTTLPPAGTPAGAPAVTPTPMPVAQAIAITTDGLHDPSLLERLNSPLAVSVGQLRREQEAGLTAKDRVNLIDVANGLMVASTNGRGIQDPDVRNGFVGGAGQITAAIATSNRLFEPQYLKDVFSPEFFTTLDALKNIDPEAHAMTEARVQNALMAQYSELALTSRAALSRGNLNVDSTGNVTINPNTGVFSRGEINALNNYANELYNGSLVALMNDRGRRIESPNARTWAGRLGSDLSRLRDTIATQRIMAGLMQRAGIDAGLVDQIYSEGIAPDEPTSTTPTSTTPTSTTPVEATPVEAVPVEAVTEPELSESARAFLASEDALIEEEVKNSPLASKGRNSFLASKGVQGSGTEQDPITFTDETGMTTEMYQAIPTGAYYRDSTGLVSQKREESPRNNGGDLVIAPNGMEEYNALPSGARWLDPDGNIRIKP
tara:strand:+ start:9838 stop:12291 length:2454 start_codon:yes stop_codon:yes gene_type:complete